MPIAVAGVNYSSAPLELRERLSVTGRGLDAAYARLRARVPEGLILSTCNRTEVYAVAPVASAPLHTIQEFFSDWGSLSEKELRDAAYAREHEAAVRHLFRVTSGLESMVLGEDQIQSQVKLAVAVARRAGALGPVLDRLGAAALSCGKRVRTFTRIGRHSVSLESLAVRAAINHASPLTARNILVIGAGESATIVARQLAKFGAGHVTILSRSAERAATVALAIDAQTAGVAELADALCRADVVFACTSAPHAVVTPDLLSRRRLTRDDAPLLCVDLGMPRDVDPVVASLPGATIVTLNELAELADAHREERRAELPAAEALVEAEAARFVQWARARTTSVGRPPESERVALG